MEWSRGVSRPLLDMQRLAADDDAAGLRSARPTSRYLWASGQLESDSRDDDGGVLSARHFRKWILLSRAESDQAFGLMTSR